MFVAKHHVTLGGRHYLPGEVIDKPVPEKTAEWWLSVGAAEYVNVSPVYGLDPNAFKHHPPTQEPEDETGGTEDSEDETGGTEDSEDETGGTTEPEEINVSDGLVPPSKEPEKPKAKRAPQRRGGKKS